MRPFQMQVKHNPPTSYGDCYRACIASLVDRDHTPHFFFDGCDAETAYNRVCEFLRTLDMCPIIFAYPGENVTVDDIGYMMEASNPELHYILSGTQNGVMHCAIYRGKELMHDPSYWGGNGIDGPNRGLFTIMLIGSAVAL